MVLLPSALADLGLCFKLVDKHLFTIQCGPHLQLELAVCRLKAATELPGPGGKSELTSTWPQEGADVPAGASAGGAAVAGRRRSAGCCSRSGSRGRAAAAGRRSVLASGRRADLRNVYGRQCARVCSIGCCMAPLSSVPAKPTTTEPVAA